MIFGKKKVNTEFKIERVFLKNLKTILYAIKNEVTQKEHESKIDAIEIRYYRTLPTRDNR